LFLTIYISTNNLFLLFDNTTGMTHLKTLWLILTPYCKDNKYPFPNWRPTTLTNKVISKLHYRVTDSRKGSDTL